MSRGKKAKGRRGNGERRKKGSGGNEGDFLS